MTREPASTGAAAVASLALKELTSDKPASLSMSNMKKRASVSDKESDEPWTPVHRTQPVSSQSNPFIQHLGATPNTLKQAIQHPENVLGRREHESLPEFKQRLAQGLQRSMSQIFASPAAPSTVLPRGPSFDTLNHVDESTPLGSDASDKHTPAWQNVKPSPAAFRSTGYLTKKTRIPVVTASNGKPATSMTVMSVQQPLHQPQTPSKKAIATLFTPPTTHLLTKASLNSTNEPLLSDPSSPCPEGVLAMKLTTSPPRSPIAVTAGLASSPLSQRHFSLYSSPRRRMEDSSLFMSDDEADAPSRMSRAAFLSSPRKMLLDDDEEEDFLGQVSFDERMAALDDEESDVNGHDATPIEIIKMDTSLLSEGDSSQAFIAAAASPFLVKSDGVTAMTTTSTVASVTSIPANPLASPTRTLLWRTPFVHMLTRDYFKDATWTAGIHLNPNFLSSTTPIADYFTEHFHVVEQLGRGSFADVFKVKDKQAPHDCFAVKRTREPFCGVHDRKQKLNEVENLWLISGHPHCIELIASWEQQGHLYIQTALYEGGSLDRVIDAMSLQGICFDEDALWRILYEVGQGLNHCHSHEIAHLDVKPANIFVDERGHLRLGDFGLSTQRSYRHDVDAEGDKYYMAPEVLDGVFDLPADVFSLGLILLELAANVELPAQGEAWRALRSGDFSGVSMDPDRISSRMQQCIVSMLEPDPIKRATMPQVLEMTVSYFSLNNCIS